MSGPGARTLKTHWMLVITGLSVALTACASSNPETEGSLVWASENDYVRIEPHEQGRDVVPNQHPVSFSDEQIQQLLTTVEVARPRGRLETLVGRGDDAASLPVFTDRELRKLAAPLAEALAAAEPENDVLFSVSSFRKGELLGALGSTRSTTGRIFYQDDQLNLILGAVLVDPRQALDRPSSQEGIPIPAMSARSIARNNPCPPGRASALMNIQAISFRHQASPWRRSMASSVAIGP